MEMELEMAAVKRYISMYCMSNYLIFAQNRNLSMFFQWISLINCIRNWCSLESEWTMSISITTDCIFYRKHAPEKKKNFPNKHISMCVRGSEGNCARLKTFKCWKILIWCYQIVGKLHNRENPHRHKHSTHTKKTAQKRRENASVHQDIGNNIKGSNYNYICNNFQ